MPYYKQTIDDKVMQKVCVLEIPEGEGWELIEGDPTLVEVWKEPVPPTYNPSDFKLACIADPIVSSVIMKAPAALIDAINAGNFEMVKAGIDYMVNEGMATVEQRVAFIEILIANNGPDLDA